jgi:hypothetical protein
MDADVCIDAFFDLRNSAFIGGQSRIWIANHCVFAKASRIVVVSPYILEGVTEKEGVGFGVRSSGFRLRSIAWLQLRTTASSFVLRDVERRKRNPLALGQLDFWNTFAKHDSPFQKSLLLSHVPPQSGWKTRRICAPPVPKMLEFAPHG